MTSTGGVLSLSGPRAKSGAIRVAVFEEVEIFRRGLVACLAEDDELDVRSSADARLGRPADIAVVSASAARRHRFPCPIVVCTGERVDAVQVAKGNTVAGVLERGTMTEAQLHLTVRAAANGLRVNADAHRRLGADAVDPRSVRVLQLLADGRSTREIADEMNYSERTIKKLIHDLERLLGARSRAQVVAQAIRQHLI